MPVTKPRIVQTWDGKCFDYIPLAEAKKLERQGTVQISTGLSAPQLKRMDEFEKDRKAKAKPKSRTMKPEIMPDGYTTRDMKSEAAK